MKDVSRGTSDVDRQMEQLDRGCRTLGLDLGEGKRSSFSVFVKELLLWNQRVNLVSRRDTDNIVLHHILDSLSLLPHVEISPRAKLIDIGSGGGFPGIPLKICRPDIYMDLVESTRKKTLFLKHMMDVLKFSDVTILQERAENLLQVAGYRDQYDVAIARAVSPLASLVHLCLPFIRPGGMFISLKGGSTEDEIDEALPEMNALNGRVEKVIAFRLPISEKARQLIIFKKLN